MLPKLSVISGLHHALLAADSHFFAPYCIPSDSLSVMGHSIPFQFMADSTPLLPGKAAPPVGEGAGGGASRLLQALLVSLSWGFDAQQTFISVFADAAPSWHCTTTDTTCSSSSPSTPCGLPANTWTWNQPKHTSVISDWSLQCAPPLIAGLPASSHFFGCLAGCLLLSTLADSSLGRKNTLFLSTLIMSLIAALTAASPNIYAYSALRFVSGVAKSSIGSTALVLSTEIVGSRWRDGISVAGFFCFTAGFLSLPAIAYLNRESSWRTLYLWTSVPAIIYSISAYHAVQESPRWLLVRDGHTGDAVFSAMRMLWEKRWAFRRLLSVMVVGFGVGMMYYGMPLNVGNLGFDLYMSVTFNALAELPSALATFFLVGFLTRRSSTMVFCVVSGVLSVMCVVVRKEGVRMAMEVASFFSACTVFNVLLIYCTELFPTCVRSSAMSMVREAIVLGGMAAPMVVAAAREEGFMSFGVFGLVIGCCGLFVACLPETRGRGVSDTMEEEEHLQKMEHSSNDEP